MSGAPGTGRAPAGQLIDAPADRRTPARSRRARGVAGLYFALAVAGLVGTWSFNLRFGVWNGGSSDGAGYLTSWFANDAASSAAVDLLVMTAAAGVVFWRERWVIPGRFPWALLFIPLCGVAVSFAFPLFMGLRELALARRRTAGPLRSTDHPGPSTD